MEIRIEHGYITLGQLLKRLDIVSSGGEVKAYLAERKVHVNGEAEQRRGRKLVPGDVLVIDSQTYRLVGDEHAAP
ncbi:S4 domain protein YaaA [Alicyclobacillus sacchari]|uniref:S4 domain protein YaaA n=1 Tax=Alicyclobacillus sacchari TaxID=392010 RepID=A0A4V3HDU0_9BACL|nr:S4 domain-containing protein YaaA [Alicyclobacillus sacchari]TDY42376.1 S4 domain protein YaaA [Alicyclobacillus sacchari]GMA57311.1 RNA-binding protein [Alicyclobacillus sacchari]